MADDLTDAASLAAVHPVLEPQIAGVARLLDLPLSADERTAAGAVLEQLQRRLGAIVALENARTNLLGDGYPALPPLLIPASLLTALDQHVTDLLAQKDVEIAQFQAARKHFAPQAAASDLGLTAGATTPKPSI